MDHVEHQPAELPLSSVLACTSARVVINDLRCGDLEQIGNRSGVTAARAREVIDALLEHFNWHEDLPLDGEDD